MTDIKNLKKLREKTGVSFSICKKALDEANNDLKKAEKLLSKWGTKKLKDKGLRSTNQGAIFSYVHHNKKIASMIQLLCETDFVAVNKEFQKLGQELAMQIASLGETDKNKLLKQDYIRDSKKKVIDLIKEAVLKFGENIKIGKIVRWEL